MRTQGLLLPVNANIQRVLSQTASGSSCPIVRLRWHGLDDSNRCTSFLGWSMSSQGWLQSYTARKRMSTIGQELPAVADESGRSTFELTGAQRHCAARRTLASTPRGAMPLRVRVERPVRPRCHVISSPHRLWLREGLEAGCTAWLARPALWGIRDHRDSSAPSPLPRRGASFPLARPNPKP